MASTRSILQEIAPNIDESMGVRRAGVKPKLSPVASSKEIGRTPLRNYGRVEVNRVVPDPDQPRKSFDEGDIRRLASTFKTTGQIQPIGVRWDAAIGKWLVVHGERRWRAAKAAGLETIDCCFEDEDMGHPQRLERQLVENIQRASLEPLDEASAFQELMELRGWNGKQLAEALHINPSKVSRALALLDLPTDVQAKISSGELSRTSAYELTKLDNAEVQRDLATQQLTQDQASKAVRKRRGKPARNKRRAQSTTQLRFPCENGWTIVAVPPKDGSCRTYHDLDEALEQTTEDVKARIHSGIHMTKTLHSEPKHGTTDHASSVSRDN